MKKLTSYLFTTLVFLLITTCNYSQSSKELCKTLEGQWLGSVEFRGAALRIVIRVSCDNDSLQAVIDSPDQGTKDIPVTSIDFRNDSLKVKAKSIMAKYTAFYDEKTDELNGEWQQSVVSLPLILKRTDSVPGLNRPQEPRPPFPYIEEEVVFKNDRAGISLAGTLTLPDTINTHPAVILISGSGPQDRNEELLGHKPFWVIADHLSRNGIAVLRYDDRGVKESTGNFSTATTENFTEDARAAWLFLRKHKSINSKNIGLLGHSEGGMIAAKLASAQPAVAFVVLLAAPGISGEKILLTQIEKIYRAAGIDEKATEKIVKRNEKIYADLKKEDDDERASEKIRKILEKEAKKLSDEDKTKNNLRRYEIDAHVKNAVSPWFRYFITFNPRPYLEKVKCPLLALNGEKDMQVVAEENLEAIEQAMIFGGNPDYKIMEMPGLNHLFQHAKTGAISEYSTIEETISPEVLDIITKWILEEVP